MCVLLSLFKRTAFFLSCFVSKASRALVLKERNQYIKIPEYFLQATRIKIITSMNAVAAQRGASSVKGTEIVPIYLSISKQELHGELQRAWPHKQHCSASEPFVSHTGFSPQLLFVKYRLGNLKAN